MAELKKKYTYYAISQGKMVLIKKSMNGLKRVRSRLYKPGTEFAISQETYIGGIVVGSLTQVDWVRLTSQYIYQNAWMKVPRTLVRSLEPYLVKGDEHGSRQGSVDGSIE